MASGSEVALKGGCEMRSNDIRTERICGGVRATRNSGTAHGTIEVVVPVGGLPALTLDEAHGEACQRIAESRFTYVREFVHNGLCIWHAVS